MGSRAAGTFWDLENVPHQFLAKKLTLFDLGGGGVQTMPTRLQLAPKDFDILASLGWQLSLQVDALDANRVSKIRVWRSKLFSTLQIYCL